MNIGNQKGSSLLELIISIALISVVLIFMMRLLVDLNNKETNSTFAKDNQIIRAEIIKEIESDLGEKAIIDLTDEGSSTEQLNIKFMFSDQSSSNIIVTEDKLSYTNSSGKTRNWSMKNCNLDFQKSQVKYVKDSGTNPKIYTLVINIFVYTNNEQNSASNNNLQDDITLSYVGSLKDFNKDNFNCLGNGC